MDVLMKYHKDMQGKEVIDTSGNVIGKVSDIAWDESSREIKLFEVSSGGFMEMFGRGEKKILPYDIISTIGEKILIKSDYTNMKEEKNSQDVGSKVEDSSKDKDTSSFNISKLKGFSIKKDDKKIEDNEKNDDNGNIKSIEESIEDFRMRNNF